MTDTHKPRTAVGGSNMVDLVTYVDRMPVKGETVEAPSFEMGHGGKGANQAAAAAKLQLLDRSLLLARLPRLLSQHVRQFVSVGVQLARPVRDAELRLLAVRAQGLADRVPRQPRAPRYLTDR